MGTLFAGSTSGLRSWPVKGFEAIRIYYVEDPGSLRVVRILHGKRDVRRILKQEKAEGQASLSPRNWRLAVALSPVAAPSLVTIFVMAAASRR
jgi:hypothetical protein